MSAAEGFAEQSSARLALRGVTSNDDVPALSELRIESIAGRAARLTGLLLDVLLEVKQCGSLLSDELFDRGAPSCLRKRGVDQSDLALDVRNDLLLGRTLQRCEPCTDGASAVRNLGSVGGAVNIAFRHLNAPDSDWRCDHDQFVGLAVFKGRLA